MPGPIYPNTVDNGSVYFTKYAGGLLRLTPPSATPEAVTSEFVVTEAIAQHGDDLFVSAVNYASMSGFIASVPKSGGTLTSVVSGVGLTFGVVVDDSGLYWIQRPPTGTYGPSWIAHAALDGSNVEVFLDESASSLAIAYGVLYFTTDNEVKSVRIPYAARVDHAVQKVLKSRQWTAPQRKWLERIGKQLKLETVVDRESLDEGQLANEGGYARLNKIFDGKVEEILSELGDAIWERSA